MGWLIAIAIVAAVILLGYLGLRWFANYAADHWERG